MTALANLSLKNDKMSVTFIIENFRRLRHLTLNAIVLDCDRTSDFVAQKRAQLLYQKIPGAFTIPALNEQNFPLYLPLIFQNRSQSKRHIHLRLH